MINKNKYVNLEQVVEVEQKTSVNTITKEKIIPFKTINFSATIAFLCLWIFLSYSSGYLFKETLSSCFIIVSILFIKLLSQKQHQ